MKNKKLFAILTLVCFMFTLMPVAAFAAEADGKVMVSVEGATAKNSVTAKNTEDVTLSVVNNTTGSAFYYVVTDANNDVIDILDTDTFKVGDVFDVNGKYTVTAIISNMTDDAVYQVVNNALTTIETKAGLLLGKTYESERIDKAATITVKYVKDSYNIDVYNVDADAQPVGTPLTGSLTALWANGSYGASTYAVVLTTEAGNEVEGATIKVSHNGVNAPKQIVTNEDGIAYLTVYGTVVGAFELELAYADTEVEFDVTVGNVTPVEVSVVAEPKAPVDVNEASTEFGIGFKLVDGNGNVITDEDFIAPKHLGGNFKLAVVGPADSTVKALDLDLVWDSVNEYFEIGGIAADSELAEGKYTFTVSLESGKYASASVEVKEFDEPVALKVVYPTTAGVGDVVNLRALKYVDKNGVTMSAIADIYGDVKLSVSGKAVSDFDETNGQIIVRAEEKYVGETIKVVAVYDEKLIATAEITVVEDAVEVQYVAGDVQAAKNNTLVFNIVNENGEKIALNKKSGTPTATSTVIVEKPEGAYVAIAPLNGTTVNDNVKVSFTPSVAGEYEVMVVVTYTDVNALGQDVTRSVTGTATVVVGGTDTFKDVIVMSIGVQKMVKNSEVVELLCAPVIKDSRTFVPFRSALEAFGAKVDYIAETGAVIAEMDGVKVVMMNGSNVYTVNGVEKTADVAPYLNAEASTTMVPVSFIVKEFGINYQCIYNADGTVADVLFTK